VRIKKYSLGNIFFTIEIDLYTERQKYFKTNMQRWKQDVKAIISKYNGALRAGRIKDVDGMINELNNYIDTNRYLLTGSQARRLRSSCMWLRLYQKKIKATSDGNDLAYEMGQFYGLLYELVELIYG